MFVERLTSLKTLWSNYKKHKFLIGITPQGFVSFISKGWGGRISDVYLTEHSNLLQHLLPGDVVLEDRRFAIEESVAYYVQKLNIPLLHEESHNLASLKLTPQGNCPK